MTMLEVALAYAAAGACVLPLHSPAPTPTGCSCQQRTCEHPGKHPRCRRGKDDATSNAADVEHWWGMWPDANIGVRPHPGHVVLDVDPRHGGDVQLAAMAARYGPLPVTRTAITGSGGRHIWFRLDGEVRGELAVGIDVKGCNGYLVVPPSRHVCGGTYRWLNVGAIADAPDYLRPLLVRPPLPEPTGAALTAPALAGLVRVVATAPTGNRNRALFWSCLRAAERGGDLGPLVAAAVEVGLTRSAAEATARSALRTATGG